jgi:diketogulonate reductase-like aldo/keto reductase
VGVSNFTIKHLEHILMSDSLKDIGISVNQVEFHPGLYQKNLLDFCNKKDIAITAYSPLAVGKLEKNQNIKGLCEKYGKKPAQICIRWLLDKGIVSIPRSSSKEHMADNIDVFDFKLDSKDQEYIDSMGDNFRIFDPPFFKKWEDMK